MLQGEYPIEKFEPMGKRLHAALVEINKLQIEA